MQRIARIVTRPSNDEGTECDLLLGSMMRNKGKMLKPNTIYDIVECLGTLNLVEAGESLISSHGVKDSPIGVTWLLEYQDVAVYAGKYLLITREEFDSIQKTRQQEE